MSEALPEVDAATARALVADGATLLDVREPAEWSAGHSPAAVLLPLAHVAQAESMIAPGTRVAVICRSGNRSKVGTSLLLARGYDAVNVAGGMVAWAALGEPVVTDSGTAGIVA